MFVQETIWLPFQFNLRHCQGNEMFRLFFEVGGENLHVACRFCQIFCTVSMIFDRFPITTNLSWTEYSRNLWLGRDVKVNHRSHQLSWVNFAKVHDCSALHVCSFILSILHQADIHDTFLEDTFVIHWCWMDDGVYRRERVQLDVNVLGSWMNLGAICLLKLVLSQCTAFIPLQGIFSVSAFIVSVIYLSRPLWLPLDLQSLKVFDCLRESKNFSKALRYQSVLLRYYQTRVQFWESWKVQREFSHHFACLHVASIVSDVSWLQAVTEDSVLLWFKGELGFFKVVFLCHASASYYTQYHMQLASKVAVASWQDVGGEFC